MKPYRPATLGLLLLFAAPFLTSCGSKRPKVDPPARIETRVVPVPETLTEPRTVAWPEPACVIDGAPVYCNAQIATLFRRLVTALAKANEDKAAIRALGGPDAAETDVPPTP